jgi:hypothetical protein
MVASEAEVRLWLNVFLGGISTRVSGLVWVGAAAATTTAGAAALGAAAFLAAFFAFAFFTMADLAVMMKVRKMHNHDLNGWALASCMQIIRQAWLECNLKIYYKM